MAKINKLAQFRFEPSEDSQTIRMHIEDDQGDTLELIATRDQIEVLADGLDDFLAETEDADEVEGDAVNGDDDELDDADDGDDEDERDDGEADAEPARRR